MVEPELGPPLREGHPGLGAEEPAQGSLPRAHGAAQLGQGAVTAGVFGQDGGDVAEALVTRLRQVELQRRGRFELMQRDPLQVMLLVEGTAGSSVSAMISSRSRRDTLSTVGWVRPSGLTCTPKATVRSCVAP